MQKRAVFTSIRIYSLTEIFLLVTMTIAIAFLLGQEVGVVSAIFVAAKAPSKIPVPTVAARPDFAASTVSWTNAPNLKIEVGEETLSGLRTTTIDKVQYASNPSTGAIYKKVGDNWEVVDNPNQINLGFTTIKTSFGISNLAAGLTQALFWAGMANMAARMFGADTTQANSISQAVGAGVFTYKAMIAMFGKGTGVTGGQGFFAGTKVASIINKITPRWIGLGVAIVVFILTYKKEKQELITFQCLPFEPALGGSKCEQCNVDPYKPCSEYRCKSLGQACELLNKGTAKEQCAWVSPKDVTSPTITPWDAALKPTGLRYNPDNAVRPGARGAKITLTTAGDGCLQAFTALQFGVTTNEPSQCKLDFVSTTNYSQMQYYFGDNYYSYNHTEIMSLPNPNSTDNNLAPLLRNDGYFSLYVRCQDANGNANVDAYSISFCVSKAPDTTPPIIEATSITDGSPVQANADSTPIEVYTNEPATCKWSRQDRAYNDMENNMTCATDSTQINADLQYTCSGTLTGVADMQNNVFYFRCRDKPSAAENERNTMSQSYKMTLRGTQELNIVTIGPNGTIAASMSVVPVEIYAETDDGSDTGKAVCLFSPSGKTGTYVEMYETNAVFHKQPLSLAAGDYSYYLRCVDAGGNMANAEANFTVEVDNNAPIVTRVYKETDALKIITNEDAQCVYSTTTCNYVFADGQRFEYLSTESQTEHIAKWKLNVPYYIKCRDVYGNEPNPNSCSIIAAGLDFSIKAKTSS